MRTIKYDEKLFTCVNCGHEMMPAPTFDGKYWCHTCLKYLIDNYENYCSETAQIQALKNLYSELDEMCSKKNIEALERLYSELDEINSEMSVSFDAERFDDLLVIKKMIEQLGSIRR